MEIRQKERLLVDFTEEDRKKQKQMEEVIEIVAGLIEAKAKEYCKPANQKSFVLAVATNLLGNLAMHWSDNSLESMLATSACTVENLMKWYKIVFSEYKQKKEIH